MILLNHFRSMFEKILLTLAGATLLIAGSLQAQSNESNEPLIAYVGTFSSPLRDVLPTQVDLPPGNGRGIHLFQVNRSTGAMKPAVLDTGVKIQVPLFVKKGDNLMLSTETGQYLSRFNN